MISFKKPEFSDKVWIDECLKKSDFMASEYCFGNIYSWHNILNAKVANVGGFMCERLESSTAMRYVYPAGEGDVKKVIELLKADAAENNKSFSIIGVPKEKTGLLNELFPDEYDIFETRDYFDYIYNTEDLANLKGKKYSSKRNHISRFCDNNPDWQFEEITENNIDECYQMNLKWCEINLCDNDESIRQESCAVKTAFKAYQSLGYKGGLIRAKGEVVAFSMGEPLNSETFIVHIEKAFSDIQGAYPIINREFVRAFCTDYKYVNREDDSGSEGLRKAKLSYKPAIILEKYTAKPKD